MKLYIRYIHKVEGARGLSYIYGIYTRLKELED